MMGGELIGKDRIEVDEDCAAEIARYADGGWEVSFLDGTGKTVEAPALDRVKVESIGSDLIVRVLAVAGSETTGTLAATGKTELANYARVSILKNGVWKTRYALLSGTQAPEAPLSAKGSPLIDMGHESFIELDVDRVKPWELTFYEETEEVDAPAPSIVMVEALKPDGSVASLEVAAGPKRSMLVASGPVENTMRVRLLWTHGDHLHRREFNLPRPV